MLGRVFTAADDRRGCPAPPAVISYGFWQREYGGSPSVLGRSLTLDGHAYDIVGVTPPGFFGVEVGRAFEVAVPLCAEPFTRGAGSALDRKDAWVLGAIGRLKPGWSIERATAQLDAISAPMFKETLPELSARGSEDLPEQPSRRAFPRRPAFRVSARTTNRRCGCCWRPRAWCCSSRAPTSRT